MSDADYSTLMLKDDDEDPIAGFRRLSIWVMINDWLDYNEQQSLEAILRFHGVEDPVLTKHLATFVNWTRADEKAKSKFGSPSPPFLLVLLSTMGIYGGKVLAKARDD